MDPVTLGLVFTGLGVLVGVAAWLWPRQPKNADRAAPPTKDPVPVPTLSPEPPQGLLVTVGLAMVGDRADPRMCIMVEAANPNPRPRKVEAVGLTLEDGKTVPFLHPSSDRMLGVVLAETDKAHFWESTDDIAKIFVDNGLGKKQQIRAFVRDSYNETHRSTPTEFDPVAWLSRNK